MIITDLDKSLYKVTSSVNGEEFEEITVKIQYFTTIQEKEIVFDFDIFNLNDGFENRLRTT